MGVFDFLKGKSKADSTINPPPNDLPSFADLPPIDGSSLPSLDFPNVPPDVSPAQGAPTYSPVSRTDKGSKSESLTVHIPPLDFSLPPKDEEMLGDMRNSQNLPDPQNNLNNANTNNANNINPLPSFPSPNDEDSAGDPGLLLGGASGGEGKSSHYIDLSEDLNKLFPADESWHEPDWENYEPYPEPEIEPPTPADFGVDEMPEREPSHKSERIKSDLPSFDEDNISETHRNILEMPVDVFVRGKDYVRVYAELDRINFLLYNQEPRILTLFEEVLDKEEELLKKSNTTMEYVYKRLIVIDKRIFG